MTNTKTITREEYMKNSKELHHAYYLQFSEPLAWDIVKRKIGEKCLLMSKDEHLNDIPLRQWDSLAGFVFRGSEAVVKPRTLPAGIDGLKLKEAGEGYSCATGVCIFKAVAREIIKELNIKENEVTK